ncbi:hypothetical protein AMAG_13078 [Allomyces macrogynus ATCC 38327]|uniref:Uncharacterized protein n=1 Tax=Allomyces macrogynus (strain ATCC 38327) TaxID=578462 RepID=A0A0L0T1E2_ALLM3|nr:hypothetical protein AMAG_13078 [Allomyces macrogynus ATCC 38327]|eukprot:KNE68424.1 hypothetical protein AMAG_13078 [Allomyces macrogynus ATCC 38327]
MPATLYTLTVDAAKHPINKVTVYQDRAEVQRTLAALSLPRRQGASIVHVRGISAQTRFASTVAATPSSSMWSRKKSPSCSTTRFSLRVRRRTRTARPNLPRLTGISRTCISTVGSKAWTPQKCSSPFRSSTRATHR